MEIDGAWMPEALRGSAEDVVALDMILEMNLGFDPESQTAAVEVLGDSLGGRRKPSASPGVPAGRPVRFQLQLTGAGCWPTLAQLTIRSVRFRAACKVWWAVLEKRLLLAFLNEVPEVQGEGGGAATEDASLSLFGCGMGLPAGLESRLVSSLVTMCMQAHSYLNPLVIDLADLDKAATQQSAAAIIQAACRGRTARFKSSLISMARLKSRNMTLEATVERMGTELRGIKSALSEVRQQQGALNLGISKAAS